jgi:dethiobiotin synthetase
LLGSRGYRTLGLKPVVSGGNDDSKMLQDHANVFFSTEIISPFLFQEPIAPHIAARHVNQSLSVKKILDVYQTIPDTAADVVIVEGAGGWLTPLNDTESLADLAAQLNYPVILVVGMRLGCINHALLTVQSVIAKGLVLAGWIANGVDPTMLYPEESINTLQERIDAPLLGIIPYQKDIDVKIIAKFLTRL